MLMTFLSFKDWHDNDFFLLQDDKELLEYIQGYSGDLSKLDYRKVYDRCDVSLDVVIYFSSEINSQCICVSLKSILSLVCIFFLVFVIVCSCLSPGWLTAKTGWGRPWTSASMRSPSLRFTIASFFYHHYQHSFLYYLLVSFSFWKNSIILSFLQVDQCLQLLENFEDNEATAALRWFSNQTLNLLNSHIIMNIPTRFWRYPLNSYVWVYSNQDINFQKDRDISLLSRVKMENTWTRISLLDLTQILTKFILLSCIK